MHKIYIEFDCPYCNTIIRVVAELLSPEKIILCNCGNKIPAGALYDTTTTSN